MVWIGMTWETWKFEKSGMGNMKIRKKWHEKHENSKKNTSNGMNVAWIFVIDMNLAWKTISVHENGMKNRTWHENDMKKPDVAWKRHEFLGKNSIIVARLLRSLRTVSYQTREPGSRYSPCNLRGNRSYCPSVPVDFKENVLIWNIFKKIFFVIF